MHERISHTEYSMKVLNAMSDRLMDASFENIDVEI